MVKSVTLATRSLVNQPGQSLKASRELAELALECAASDIQNFAYRNLQPFLTGRPLPRSATSPKLWRRFKGQDGKIARKMPQSSHKGGLPSASKVKANHRRKPTRGRGGQTGAGGDRADR